MSCLEKEKIGPLEFVGWGAHCNTYLSGYITVAAAIGMEVEEVDIFIRRLRQSLQDLKKKRKKKQKAKMEGEEEKSTHGNDVPHDQL